MSALLTGGCQCGAVRYEFPSDAVLTLLCCHCRDCQRQSASAFGMSMILPAGAFRLLQGSLKTWELRSDRGNLKRAHFCPTCGVRILNDGGETGSWISVKAGTLDDTSGLAPVGHIWTKSAQPWVRLGDDLPHYQGEPESDDDLYAAYQARNK